MYRQAFEFADLPLWGRVLSAKTASLHRTVHVGMSSAVPQTGLHDAGTHSANLPMAPWIPGVLGLSKCVSEGGVLL